MFRPSAVISRQPGFTLIELLVAIVLMAIMSALSYGAYRNANVQSEALESTAARTRELQVAVAAMVMMTAAALGIGYGLGGGGGGEETRLTTALVTSMRNPGLALLFAVSHGPDVPGVKLAIVTYLLVTILASIPFLRWASRATAA